MSTENCKACNACMDDCDSSPCDARDEIITILCPPGLALDCNLDASPSYYNHRRKTSIANDPTFWRMISTKKNDTPKSISSFHKLPKPVFNIYGSSEKREIHKRKCGETNTMKNGKSSSKEKKRNPAKSRSKTKVQSKIKQRSKTKEKPWKSNKRSETKSKSKSKSDSKSKSKSKSKKRNLGKKKKGNRSSSESSGKIKEKHHRGRSKHKKHHKKRGPTNTPIGPSGHESAKLLLNLERFNDTVLGIQKCVKPFFLTILRKFRSEENIPSCRDLPEVNLEQTWQSMTDLFLGQEDYSEHMNPCPYEDDDFSELSIQPKDLDSWRRIFELEFERRSFFDMLFRSKYVTDSLEVPGTNHDEGYLVDAEDKNYRLPQLDFGRMVFKSKHLYIGNVDLGYFQGPGRYVWLDGSSYQGSFNFGQLHGQGSFFASTGCVFEGRHENGERTKDGIYTTPDGVAYAGQWSGELPHGYGKIWYSLPRVPWDSYEGMMCNGKINGVGCRQYKNRDRYSGTWEDGVRHGFGTMLWREQRQLYKGGWEKGVPHGSGLHFWYDKVTGGGEDSVEMKHVFKGTWENGARHGTGKIFYPNGSVYEGRWNEGHQIGMGRYINMAGSRVPTYGLVEEIGSQGINEADFNRDAYESLFFQLMETISVKYKDQLTLKEDAHPEFKTLTDLCQRFYIELKLLHRRAKTLGMIWRNDDISPATMNCCPYDEAEDDICEDYYASLGKRGDAQNSFPCTKLGLWCFLKDCLVDEPNTMAVFEASWASIPSICFRNTSDPFENVFFWQFLQCLVISAVEVYTGLTPEKKEIHEEQIRTKSLGKSSSPKPEMIINDEKKVKVKTVSEGQQTSAFTKTINETSKSKRKRKKAHEEKQDASTEGTPMEKAEKITDDIIDLPLPEDGTLGRPPSEMLHQDRESSTEFLQITPVLPAGVDERHPNFSWEKTKRKARMDVPVSITEIFNDFIRDYLLPYFNRNAGSGLPSFPEGSQTARCLNNIFKSINNFGIISGREFMNYVLSLTENHVQSEILFWTRTSELLASGMDYRDIFDQVKQPPERNDHLRRNRLDFNSKSNGVQGYEGDCYCSGEDEVENALGKPTASNKQNETATDGNSEFTEEDVRTLQRISDLESNLIGSPVCRRSNNLQSLPGEAFYKTLNAEAVITALNSLYPGLITPGESWNLNFDFTFSDWLWSLLTCFSNCVKKCESQGKNSRRQNVIPTFNLPDATRRRFSHCSRSECHKENWRKLSNRRVTEVVVKHAKLRDGARFDFMKEFSCSDTAQIQD